MSKVIDFEHRNLVKIRKLAEDHQFERLQKFPCPSCEGSLNLVENWKCGCCGLFNTTKKPGIFSFKKQPLTTVLDGCGDKYCDQQLQTGVQCPECSTVLVLDHSIYLTKQGKRVPVVAHLRKKNPYADMHPLDAIASISTDLSEEFKKQEETGKSDPISTLVKDTIGEFSKEYEHSKAIAQAKRDEELRQAQGEQTDNSEPEDMRQKLKDIFKDEGFGR